MATAQDLADAKAAYHALMIGEAIVSVTTDGRTTQYTAADKTSLKKYIAELEAEVGDVDKGYAGPIEFYG